MNSDCCARNVSLVPLKAKLHRSLENVFYRLGYTIGINPWPTIGLSLLICAALGGGLFFFKKENDFVALFTTADSLIRFNSDWVKKYYSDDFRFESIIIASDNGNNILQPSVLIQIAEIDQVIRKIATTEGKQWTDLCGRFGPTVMKNGDLKRRRHSTRNNESVPSELWNDDISINDLDLSRAFDQQANNNETMEKESSVDNSLDRRVDYLLDLMVQSDSCLMSSILQIWNYDLERIRSLDQNQILIDVNHALLHGVNGTLKGQIESLELLFSDVRRDADNKVVHVGATTIIWLLENNPLNSSVYTEWERAFIRSTLNSNTSPYLPEGFRVYCFASNSYEDGISDVTSSNINTVSAGYILVIVYFSFAMGRFNLIEQRLVMSTVGVSAIGLAILASYGLCFYLGIVYGLVHPMIPFLILGIGVDDMFVIINSLDSVSAMNNNRQLQIHERMALAIKHAGVSITVTSVTDIAAFLIGATTTIPTLRSFSISAAISIFLLFLLEVTFFVAVTVLDERRKANRSILGCCTLKANQNWKPSTCSQHELFKIYFQRLHGPFLMLKPVKVLVLLVTLVIVGVSTWGVFQLEQDFDSSWYLKPSSYQTEYLNAMKKHFPLRGDRATIYTGKIDYVGQRHQLNQMTELLRTNPFIHSPSVTFWYDDFQSWLNQTRKVGFPSDDITFRAMIQEYLFSPDGRHYLPDLKVDDGSSIFDLDGNFTITSSRGRFNHLLLRNASAKNRALKSILSLSELINFGSEADPPFPMVYTPRYAGWEANRAIGVELARNLGLTMVAVMTMALILIPDLLTVFWVFTCISFTLVDLLGLAYFWGLTIDLSSSIVSILCVGLAIDYSAHIGHTFTTTTGSDKSIRVKQTLVTMGPAVWHGGFSTFLAFVLLTSTDSYQFITFFKLFFGVVLFGLFHGLVYLPVVLSLFGSENVIATSNN